LIDRVTVLRTHLTQNRTFQSNFFSQSLGLVLKNNQTQQKQACIWNKIYSNAKETTN